jgi:pimeloyl-ACP methyl ester carboxylesterase
MGVTGRGRGWLREPPSALTPSWTTIEGRPLRCLQAGESTAYPEVVILPGLGAPFYIAPWAEQIATWARVVVLDLPGWRRGRAQSSPPTVSGVAHVAAAWLAGTDRREVVLIGHSSGAQSAIRVAHMVPDRLRGVVLGGPTLVPQARRVPGLLRRLVPTLAEEERGEIPAVMPSYARSGGIPLLWLIASSMRDRPEEAARGLIPPVLVITGERDRIAPPAWGQHLAGLAAGQCVVLPGAHNTCFTFPRDNNEVLRTTVTIWIAGDGATAASL